MEPTLAEHHPLALSSASIDSTSSASAIFTPNDDNTTDPSSAPSVKASGPSYRFATQCATVDNPEGHRDQWGASSVPIYQTATFKGVSGRYDYTRSGNPTRGFLENHIAKISGAQHAFAITSGMGALDVIFRILKPGEHIIAGNDLYGGSNRLLTYIQNHNGIHVHHVPTTDPENLRPVLEQNKNSVKLVLLESPTNPLIQIADIRAISDLVHYYNPEALVVVDNTMMSPYLQRPLEHGADIVYDSATKYLSGHHDLMAGVIVCDRDDVAEKIGFTINAVGNGLPPFDSFLLLRGIKTLALRIDRQQHNAVRVANYLNDLGFHVNYPSLQSHPGHDIHKRLAKGPGAVLSFTTGDIDLSERVVGATRLWGISVSFGCVNSLISMPCRMSHASIDPAVRAARNLPEDLIRLCVGIEDEDDLIEDLEAALLEAGAIRYVNDSQGERRLERVLSTSEALISRLESVGLNRDKHTPLPPQEILVSAPGKTILFGEHAVVHGVTALAGALGLRCYCHVQPRSDNKVAISLSDIDLHQEWDLDDLPFDHAALDNLDPSLSPEPSLLARLSKEYIPQNLNANVFHGALAFLYLYIRLTKPEKRVAQTFTVRSSLPIGAGLGSSAAYSVCIASALLYTHGHINVPSSVVSASSSNNNNNNVSSSSSTTTTTGSPSATDAAANTVSKDEALHHGRKAIETKDAAIVNKWAYVGEKIIHGQPSGIDNAVATHGGAVAFIKAVNGRSGSSEKVQGFKSFRFLLTDTKVPRDTKSLVAGVTQRKASDPEFVDKVFKGIQQISDEAKRCLTDSELDRKQQFEILGSLVESNHNLLAQLGVSHPALEAVRAITRREPFGLYTKLTGAGGGGSAVTFIPDDMPNQVIENLITSLTTEGFECYQTVIGGSGFGVASLDLLSSPTQQQQQSSHKLDSFKYDKFIQTDAANLADVMPSNAQWAFA